MHQPSFNIGNRKIGYNERPLVIAEIGINHEGSLKTAKEMVDAAITAGVEIIKHQTHVIDDEMSSAAKKVIPGNTDVSIYEVMARCALNEADEIAFKNYVEEKGAIFISTPFSRAAAYRLQKMGVQAYKIGSGECNNYPLIELVASFVKPMILSTGMNSMESVRKSVEIMESFKVPYALLHCTNVYPTPPHLVRLGALDDLRKAFPNAVLGLSDHTTSIYPCLGAIALGASILERHFTDSWDRTGPDIECSSDPKQFSEMIQASNILQQARGGKKNPIPEEQVTIDFAFATVVTISDVAENETLTMDNIWVKRPGTGEISAEKFKSILGKKVKRAISKDTHLRFSDIE